MATGYRAFTLHRRGNKPEECEDVFAANPTAGCYAVSDGAAASAFSGWWARMLADAFVYGPAFDPNDWGRWLPSLQQRFEQRLGELTLPWYARDKAEKGAYATLLGVVLTAATENTGRWQAFAVGDSCFFHTRGADLLAAFPLDRSAQFNRHPRLVGSPLTADDMRGNRMLTVHGVRQAGDRLWMMTDALARWCLVEHEVGRNPWAQLESFLTSHGSEGDFSAWIDRLRDSGRLENDDVTLLAIGLDEPRRHGERGVS
jgi:hypothetical protein